MHYSPVCYSTHSPKRVFPFNLHVLGTPPAFTLSQDQTLQFDFILVSFDLSSLGHHIIRSCHHTIIVHCSIIHNTCIDISMMTALWLHHSLYSDFKDPDFLHRRKSGLSHPAKATDKYTLFFLFVNSQINFFLKFSILGSFTLYSLKLFAILKQDQPILVYFNSIKMKNFQLFLIFLTTIRSPPPHKR